MLRKSDAAKLRVTSGLAGLVRLALFQVEQHLEFFHYHNALF